ncbi:MAG: MurR/RpiR family transcriptional regulator [Oscillospiraceae bacterium]|nr:MurR/RpiR family transcriptional regulator [Eubacteriales bacterium]MDY2617844.1 MurR/RpiR family transcriptional regulator [Oscillospiraceae bacterium]
MAKDILTHIQENMTSFSKGQKLIANFILSSYDKAAFMTACKLGKTVNVSESTVVRFAAELGYDGYPSMQKALQEMIRNKLTSIQRIEVSNDRIGDQDIMSMVMQSDIEKIRLTLEETDRTSFSHAVEAISSARRVYILGVRSASALANFMSFYFTFIFDNVVHVDTTSISEVFEQVMRIGPDDVLIGLSFPRYSKRTVKAMQYAKKQGATVIAITDSDVSPLANIADVSLFAKSDMASFVDSLVAPLSLVNALIVAVSRVKNDQLEATFGKLESIWAEYEVYEPSAGEETASDGKTDLH